MGLIPIDSLGMMSRRDGCAGVFASHDAAVMPQIVEV